MTLTLFAQPYDLSATGFYFGSFGDYAAKAAALRNEHGQPVEEFEIQFIDGDKIDSDLAGAIGIDQTNLKAFFKAVADWDDHDKTRVIIAVGECGYAFTEGTSPDDFDLDIYDAESLRELAEQFVDEGLFGDIPERLQFCIDFDAIARDLGMDYAETAIAGQRLIYRCG